MGETGVVAVLLDEIEETGALEEAVETTGTLDEAVEEE
jgi:hypothetical protein